jgi:Type II CAAX prenyl endopeptidase Rce1-like
MRRYRDSYLQATRHPWACFWFLLPLLILYEAGVVWLGGPKPELLRNGADTWMRWGLESFGLTQFYCAPGLIALVFLAWSVVRFWDRPDGLAAVWLGMTVESVLFALGLWMLSRELGPFLDQWGIKLSLGSREKLLGRVVTFVGAGIYEEVLFRLLFFVALGALLRTFLFSSLTAALVTLIASALLFSASHHIGPYGEPFNNYVFLFRSLAGLYFALLYQLRGFGIAVGTHACYDVLVGVLAI